MLEWIKARWSLVRTTIASGDVATVERRYLPTAVLAGAVLGAILARLTEFGAVVFFLIGGFAIGYAVRAYMSYRRRAQYQRRRAETL